jgi:hypothetical protein
VVKVNVLVDTHACEDDSGTDHRNVPPEEADQIATSVNVSDVPPLLHDGLVPVNAIAEPAAEVVNVTCLRVELPADTAVVPAAPGVAVCNSAHNCEGAVVVLVPFKKLSHGDATFAALTPSAIYRTSFSSLEATVPSVTTPSATKAIE